MNPDYHNMMIAFVVFVVVPLLLVGIPGLVMRARARGRRLFRDLPAKRLGPRRHVPEIDHRWDVV